MGKHPNKEKPAKKVSAEWPVWQQKLASVLAKLEEDQYLIISTKHGNHFVQFAAQGAYGMRAETTSNSYLEKPEKLSAPQIRALCDLGWSDPTGSHDEATPEQDPDGSPNYYKEFKPPVAFEMIADLTVRTLAEVLRVPHPGWLQYEAFSDPGGPLNLPELGLKKPVVDSRRQDVPQLLLDTIIEETRIEDLDYDQDGDISVRRGSAVIFVKLIEHMSSVRIYSPLLAEVEEQHGLYERLNELNAHTTLVRYVYRNEAIWAIADVRASPFDQKAVADAFHYCSEMADGMDTLLQNELGGRTFFTEPMPSTMKH